MEYKINKRVLKKEELNLIKEIQLSLNELMFEHGQELITRTTYYKIEVMDYNTFEYIKYGKVWIMDWNDKLLDELNLLLNYLNELKEGK